MKLARPQTFQGEDFAKQEWISPMLTQLNTSMQQIYETLNAQLTFADNFQARTFTVLLDGTWPIRIPWDGVSAPQVVIPGQADRVSGSDQIITLVGDTDGFGSIEFAEADNPGLGTAAEWARLVQIDQAVDGGTYPETSRVRQSRDDGTSLYVSMTEGNTGGALSGQSFTFYLASPISINWQFTSSGILEITDVFGIYPQLDDRYRLTVLVLT
jgi:hypothetical protein